MEVLVTLTTDDAKILGQLYRVKPEGELDFVAGLKMAQVRAIFCPVWYLSSLFLSLSLSLSRALLPRLCWPVGRCGALRLTMKA